MTKQQIKLAKSLIGKMSREKICERLGVSVSNLKRSCRGISFWFHNGKYINNPKLVNQVLRFYEKNGKLKTQKAFPDIKVRSIIEHADLYGQKIKPRQERWNADSLKLAARMAGLVPMDTQAKILNRPGAGVGSIRSLFAKKRITAQATNINGMPAYYAKHIVTKDCPMFKVKINPNAAVVRSVFLWVDMEKHLVKDVPKFVKHGIKSMADFQRWLWGTKNPKPQILKLLATAANK